MVDIDCMPSAKYQTDQIYIKNVRSIWKIGSRWEAGMESRPARSDDLSDIGASFKHVDTFSIQYEGVRKVLIERAVSDVMGSRREEIISNSPTGLAINIISGDSILDGDDQGAVDAIVEAVNEQIYSYLLPIYRGNLVCIVFDKEEYAYSETRPVGALSVAFLRETKALASQYVVDPASGGGGRNDDVPLHSSSRLDAVGGAGSKQNVVKEVGYYLQASAQQFAYGKLFRIYHGDLTAKSVGLDGSWVSLLNVTSVPCGFNYRSFDNATCFLSEPEVAMKIAEEVLESYSSMTKLIFNIEPLRNYFKEQFDACFMYYLPQLFGLECGMLLDSELGGGGFLAQEVIDVLHENHLTTLGPKEDFLGVDTMSRYLAESFKGIALASQEPCRRGIDALHRALGNAYGSYEKRFIVGFDSFCAAAAIKSLRRSLFSSVFSMRHKRRSAQQFLSRHGVVALAEYVDNWKDVALWLSGGCDTENSIAIYYSEHLVISYKIADRDIYTKYYDNGVWLESTIQINEISRFLCKNRCHLVVDEYDYSPGVSLIFSVVGACLIGKEGSRRESENDYCL